MEFVFDDPGLLQDGELLLLLAATEPAVPEKGHVPIYRFEMRVAGSPDKVGHLNFRAATTHNIRMYYGHIGYEVAQAYRGKRFAERAVRLMLPLARGHGMHELWITCNPDNWASRRTCERLGAEMVEIVDVPEELELYQRGDHQKCRYLLRL